MGYLLGKILDPERRRKILLERLTEPLHLNIASLAVILFGSFRSKVAFDLVLRPQYAFGLLRAADMAAEQGIPEIACLEFGVASGAGLMNMAHIAARVTAATGVRIQIHGFDSGHGMPAPQDHRDHPELYAEGDFPMDVGALRRGLPANATLHLGALNETIPSYLKAASVPIGFAALDVDYYSSTVEALKVFDGPADLYLPAVVLHVDDIHLWSHHPWGGELLAIAEFNKSRPLRKIAPMAFLRSKRLFKNAAWIDHIFALHVLDHEVRRSTRRRRPRVIPNHYLPT
ncbi:hypothetical protein [Nitrospirillum iridis]|uniref:Class I SAM-dependent methyltransferase n=1 Tax=Nitrospirillum iridis TaxID=765888 RepID=A0A7X0B1W1_9PROT|nr:hypothetical protein [Nitrospirillum iridis]MBB6252684.1 hypothetical protein [Nitrospirillum iridis]